MFLTGSALEALLTQLDAVAIPVKAAEAAKQADEVFGLSHLFSLLLRLLALHSLPNRFLWPVRYRLSYSLIFNVFIVSRCVSCGPPRRQQKKRSPTTSAARQV
jgi:hypothetical protein